MQPQPETQSIAGVFTPRLVARLHREGFEGTLRLHSGGATRVVYFRRGDIASAASNAEEDRLHNILMREGRLTAPQLEMARTRQRPGVSLGKVLIELGFLTPSELLQGARRQVRQILAACFALTDGTWQAAPGPLGPEVTNLGLPVRRLIFDALLAAGDRRAIVREMGSMESVYQADATLAAALPQLRLEPAMEQVARMIDGQATLREISGRTSLDDFTVSRIVLALDILGLATSTTRPEPAASLPPGRVIPVESDTEPDAAVDVRPSEAPMAAEAGRAAEARPAAGGTVVPGAGPATRPPLPMLPPVAEPPAPAPAAVASAEPEASETWEAGASSRVAESARPPADRPAADHPVAVSIAGEPTPAARSARGDVPESAPEEAEPPPIPREELPAFAGGTQGQTPFWTIDPETGEKVHEGPVELTFDGPVMPRRSGGPDARLLAAVGAGLVVVAALAIAFWVKSRGADGAPEPAGAADAAAVIAAAEPAAGPHEETGATADGAEPAGGGATAGGAGAPATVPVPAPPAETRADAPAPQAGARAAGAVVDRMEPGRALLDADDVAGAASAFASALAALPADRVALHLMIACEESTVLKARAAVAPGDPLFVTPYALRDRRCYRLLWGLYPDRDAAQAAAQALPSYFTAAGIKPVAVSVGRLRAPA